MGVIRLATARRLRQWANRLDPQPRPEPTYIGLATRDIKTGELVQDGDVVSQGAIVQQRPQSDFRMVHSSIGTQANRARQRNEQSAWKNRR